MNDFFMFSLFFLITKNYITSAHVTFEIFHDTIYCQLFINLEIDKSVIVQKNSPKYCCNQEEKNLS